jgi:hypothetical protein
MNPSPPENIAAHIVTAAITVMSSNTIIPIFSHMMGLRRKSPDIIFVIHRTNETDCLPAFADFLDLRNAAAYCRLIRRFCISLDKALPFSLGFSFNAFW